MREVTHREKRDFGTKDQFHLIPNKATGHLQGFSLDQHPCLVSPNSITGSWKWGQIEQAKNDPHHRMGYTLPCRRSYNSLSIWVFTKAINSEITWSQLHIVLWKCVTLGPMPVKSMYQLQKRSDNPHTDVIFQSGMRQLTKLQRREIICTRLQ